MLSKSCLNLVHNENENVESIKSCFSYDDCLVLKKHPEIDLTFNTNNNRKSSLNFSFDNSDDICELYYDYESLRKIKIENGCQLEYHDSDLCLANNEVIKINKEKKLNSNSIKDVNLQRNQYEFLSPYQKKMKEQKSLQSNLFNIEKRILEKKIELKDTEDLLQTDLNGLHFKKLHAIEKINEKVNSITDKIFEVKNKKIDVNQNIKALNKRIKEIEEMTKLKEVKIRECYLKIHQKGRQAFQFNKKSEVISSINLDKNSDTLFQLKSLQDILNDLKLQIEELRKVKLQENYSKYPSQLEYSSHSYLIKIARDCLFYYLMSKSKEEKTITLRAMVNTLPYHTSIKEKLLTKINLEMK